MNEQQQIIDHKLSEIFDLIDSGKDVNLSDVLEIRETCRKLDPPYHVGYAHSLVAEGYIRLHKGDYHQVLKIIAEIRHIYEGLAYDQGFVRALFLLGITYYLLGDATRSLEAHQEQLLFARQIRDAYYEAAALRRIGVAHDVLNHDNLALDYYHQSLEIYKREENAGGIASALNNMAIIYRQQGKLDEALDVALQARQLFVESGNLRGMSEIYSQLSMIYLDKGDFDNALAHIQESLKYASKIQRVGFRYEVRIRLGRIYSAMGNYAEAEFVLLETLNDARERAERLIEADCLLAISELYELKNDHKEALNYYKRYHTLRFEIREKASQSQYETLEILHQTKQAQIEAQNERLLRYKERKYFEEIGRVKDELLSTTSHDLKNPIASLMLVSTLLKMHGRLDDERAQELLARLDNGLSQMRKLITNVLDLARVEASHTLHADEHDLRNVAYKCFETFKLDAEAHNITMQFECVSRSLYCWFDDIAITQVISNLLSNAIKYTPEGGDVTLRITRHENHVVVAVEDNGIGIPEEDIPHLFERFYRVSAESHKRIEGTGLGLAICESIIKQHGGRIWVESEPGQGSTFRFLLPLN